MLVEIPDDYQYVLAAGLCTIVTMTYMATGVGNARKKYNVPYPTMYSDKSNEFNCVQRGHQQVLETITQVFFVALVGALSFPKVCAGVFLVWQLGRIRYFHLYSKGDPKKRSGAMPFIYPPIFTMIACSIYTIYNMF